jgi:hypothetical protein
LATAPHRANATATAIPNHFGFWIADPSAWLRTGFGLSEGDFKGNAFIGLFSWVLIENLKSKIQNII